MKHFLMLLGLVLLASCATAPTYLNDNTLVPPGSRVSFWVLHDELFISFLAVRRGHPTHLFLILRPYVSNSITTC